MKRDFLEGLKLDKEVIDKIMAENGRDIEKYKADVAKNEDTLKGVKKQLEDANKAIKDFKDMDIEGIKQASEDWKEKYKKETENLKNQIKEKEYNSAVDSFLSNYKFTSDLAKKAVFSELKEKEFKFEDGKLLGAEDYIKSIKESNPTAFEDAEGTGATHVDTGGGHDDDGFMGDKFIESMMKGAGLEPEQEAK